MLNLDTHIVIKLIEGDITSRERELIVKPPLTISPIVIREVAKLNQLGRIPLSVVLRFNAFFLGCVSYRSMLPSLLQPG